MPTSKPPFELDKKDLHKKTYQVRCFNNSSGKEGKKRSEERWGEGGRERGRDGENGARGFGHRKHRSASSVTTRHE